MQDIQLQTQAYQPFVKLAQANMELLTRFSSSPEMTAQATGFLQRATESSQSVMQSGAFAQMVQGMMKNYSEFYMGLSQNAMALMGQGQAALARQVEVVSDAAIDAQGARSNRSRQAA